MRFTLSHLIVIVFAAIVLTFSVIQYKRTTSPEGLRKRVDDACKEIEKKSPDEIRKMIQDYKKEN